MPLLPLVRDLVGKRAIKLRRCPGIHRSFRWLRRTFWHAISEGLLEFSRRVWGTHPTFGPPLHSFSAYQALRVGYPPTNGRIILHDQGSPIVTGDSLMALSGFEQWAEQPWPIFWTEHKPARLITESLALLGPGKKLCIECVYGYRRKWHDPASRFFRLPPAKQLSGSWTSIVSAWVPTRTLRSGAGTPNYSHWLLDALPRLAVLSEFPPETKIIVPADLHPNHQHALELLGVADRCRPTPEHHLEVERYFLSPPTSMLACYNPYAVNFLRTALLPKRDLSYKGPKRFFMRRAGLAREPGNSAQVADLFANSGWEVLDVVKLNFAQQMQLFHEAEAIAGLGGSAFTNAVFCRPGCKVVSIIPEGFGVDGWIDWIAQLVNFEWRPLVIPSPYTYQFSVDLRRLSQRLEDLGLIFRSG